MSSPGVLDVRAQRSAILGLTLAAACWGIGTVVSKHAVGEIPPLTLLSIQLASSVALLIVLLRLRGLALRDPGASPVLGWLGLLNPGLAYALSLLGLVHITASLSVVLWAAEPLLIMVLAALVLRERIGSTFVLLSIVAAAGMVLVILRPDSAGSFVGVALTMAGVTCCAIYTVVARRWIGTMDSTLHVVLAQQAVALVFAVACLTALSLIGGAPDLATVSPAAWASAVGSGVLYYAVAYWFYLSALRLLPASAAASSFYLIPIFGVAGGVLALGERLEPIQWLGAAMVLGAVYLILRRRAVESPTAIPVGP